MYFQLVAVEEAIIRAGTLVSVQMDNGVMSPKFATSWDYEAEVVSEGEPYNVYRLENGQLVFIEPVDAVPAPELPMLTSSAVVSV